MLTTTWIISIGLFALSIASGMLGLGVAFAAVPFLAFFLHDLVHEVQPLSLVLNGVTALFSLLGFARSHLVSWRPAILLALVTTAFAPFGAWLAQSVDARWLWGLYFLSVVYLAWRMFLPEKLGAGESTVGPNLRLVLMLAAPIAIVASMLGVGPGFLLLPTLILAGFEPKRAAAVNALAVTPPSFSALLPHLATARVDLSLAVLLVVVGAVGAFIGARITSLYVPGRRLKQGFGVLIVVMTAYKIWQVVSP